MIQAVRTGSKTRGRSDRWATRPSRGEVAEIARQCEDIRAVPIFREVIADLETPVSAFLKIRGSGPAFLLESIEGGERLARYSLPRAGHLRCRVFLYRGSPAALSDISPMKP